MVTDDDGHMARMCAIAALMDRREYRKHGARTDDDLVTELRLHAVLGDSTGLFVAAANRLAELSTGSNTKEGA